MNFQTIKQAKVNRARQILEEHKEDVLAGSFGHTKVNRVLREEFGSGTRVSYITEIANEIRKSTPLTHRSCSYCHQDLPISYFQWSNTLQKRCSICRNDRDRAYYDRNKSHRCQQRRNNYWSNPDPIRERTRKQSSIYDTLKKIQVLSYYGNGESACVICGEDDLSCLSIDHVAGGGRKHRQQIGSHFYAWLIKNHFPEGYQTLCMNCQFKKRSHNNETNSKDFSQRKEVR